MESHPTCCSSSLRLIRELRGKCQLHSAPMPSIHPTAIVEGDVRLADDVIVGPHCVLQAPAGTTIVIGSGTRFVGQCWVNGPARMGSGNTVYPYTTIGLAPQDLKWNLDDAGAGVTIGDKNTLREGTTIHRATSHATPTTIGDRNFFMANSHAGHDVRVGSDCILTNGALLGGHVTVGDRAVLGGGAAVHQFCRIGRGCMLSGMVATTRDLPPFFTLTGINIAGSINMVGLRRSGAGVDTIGHVRWVYATLYRRGTSPKAAIAALSERGEVPIVHEYIEFIESSKRGICPGRPISNRRGVASVEDLGADEPMP